MEKPSKSSMVFKKILLKLSGEALMGNEGYGIDPAVVEDVCLQIKKIKDLGIQIGLVIGGGNIFRGMKAEKQGMERATADYMGMVATLLNALTLQEGLEKIGIPVRIQSAIAIEKVAEPYDRRVALQHLAEKKVVIFACGTGNPYFTTDTAAALRAIEIGADVLFKATKVDGIYDCDPVTNKNAHFYSSISYMDVINKNLGVMDLTAITLCMENNLPIIVFNLFGKDNMKKVVQGKLVGTLVRR